MRYIKDINELNEDLFMNENTESGQVMKNNMPGIIIY